MFPLDDFLNVLGWMLENAFLVLLIGAGIYALVNKGRE